MRVRTSHDARPQGSGPPEVVNEPARAREETAILLTGKRTPDGRPASPGCGWGSANRSVRDHAGQSLEPVSPAAADPSQHDGGHHQAGCTRDERLRIGDALEP